MPMSLDCLGFILLLMTPLAVELSVWIGFLGLSCPNLLRFIQMYVASLAAV